MGAQLVEAARYAFTTGLNGVGLVGGIVFLGLAIATALTSQPAAQVEPAAPAAPATGEPATAPALAA